MCDVFSICIMSFPFWLQVFLEATLTSGMDREQQHLWSTGATDAAPSGTSHGADPSGSAAKLVRWHTVDSPPYAEDFCSVKMSHTCKSLGLVPHLITASSLLNIPSSVILSDELISSRLPCLYGLSLLRRGFGGCRV